MKTVKEIASLTGVSVRTLHYYDEIGLLRPAQVTEAGYRLYGGRELERLQHILFLRELEFPLKEIKRILDAPSFDRSEALKKHINMLELKRDRLHRLIGLAGRILEGESDMSFEEFDMTEIEEARTQYGKEARERWGGTDAWRESERRTKAYTKEDWRRISSEADEIFGEFARNMQKPPAHPDVQQAVKRWKHHINSHYYNCTDEILAGLGEMYAADERFRKNLDKHARGLAQFMSEAIRAYCE